MGSTALGKLYGDGQAIVRESEVGECMYVVQEGRVEVVKRGRDGEKRLAVLEAGDFFGEMAMFEKEIRSATVRALGDVRVLTVDRKTVLRRIREDPLMAVHILQGMSRRIRELDERLSQIREAVAPGSTTGGDMS